MNRLHRRNSKLFLILVIVCVNFLLSYTAFAEGDSTADQSGPLNLTSSSISDGQNNVPMDTKINLVFSNNVVNTIVKDNNMSCFTLESADGQIVPVQVVMADDQAQPGLAGNITIVPENSLSQGTTYTLRIDPELRSKSYDILGKEVNISFTTSGTAVNNNSNPGNSFGTVTNNMPASPDTTNITGTNATPGASSDGTTDNAASGPAAGSNATSTFTDPASNSGSSDTSVGGNTSNSDISNTTQGNNGSGLASDVSATATPAANNSNNVNYSNNSNNSRISANRFTSGTTNNTAGASSNKNMVLPAVIILAVAAVAIAVYINNKNKKHRLFS